MAPIKDAVGPSHEALLKLEKSTENSGTQLAVAAQILKLDLSGNASLSDQDYSIKTRPAPKEEWVLRWLLKRFKLAAYRVQPLSFVLLRNLLQRTSRRAIAATFVEYKFGQLLKDIVDDLDNAVFKPLRDGTGRRVPSGSDTSETARGSPARSKKRKRGNNDEDIEMHDAAAGQDDDNTQAGLTVDAYVRFLDALHLLMSLANNQDDRGNVSQFHLQQSLRFDPAFVAQILGKLLRISAALTVRFAKEKREDQVLQLLKTTTASFGLWDLKKSGINGVEKNSINTAFAESCLLEALRLHRIVLSTGIFNDDVNLIKNSIEKLIALHIVLPARSAFIESGGSGIDYSKDEDPNWSAVQPVTSNFKPLFEDRSGVDIDCNGMHVIGNSTKKDPSVFAATWKSAELVPTFYNIVARSVPRDSFRRQNTEASWLETVFVALAELAFSSTLQLSGNISGFVPLLEQLFIVVRARKINLSLHTFLTHAAYTGLLKGKQNPKDVRWSLTTLLIDLGVDIFLPNSGFKDSGRLLEALCESLQHIQSNNTDQETYQTVKEKVVIPLLRAFAAARDLSTFVTLWYEQLKHTELNRRVGAGSSPSESGWYSVWEDDDLATAYRDAIKTTLSDTHVKTQIEMAIPTIITSSNRISHSPESYAHFVILEAGSQTWGNNGLPGLRIDLVTRLVEVINKSISARIEKLHWSWRLWRLARTLIPISLKTPVNTPNDIANKFEQTALKVMSTDKIAGREESSNTWREALEACHFLLKITKDLHHDNATSELDSNSLPNLFQNISSLLDVLLYKRTKLVGWNGRIQDLDTLSQLGTAYVECILEFPHVWSPATPEGVKQFFDNLSVLAERALQNTISTDATRISFGQLWSVYTSYGYLIENPSLSLQFARSICALLLTNSNRHRFLLRSLPGIPVRLSDVPDFKEMINTVVTEDKGCPAQCVQHVASLIYSYCRESQHVELEVIEWLTAISKISLQGLVEADMRTIESFRSLLKTVFECEQQRKAAGKSERTDQKFFKRFYKLATDSSLVSATVTELESDPGNTEHPMSLAPVFVGACLRLLWEHHEELADSKVSKDIRRQRDKIFKLILARIDKCNTLLQQDSSDRTTAAISLATTLQLLDIFGDLVRQKDVEIDEPTPMIGEDVSGLRTCLQRITRYQTISRSAANGEGLGFNDPKLLEGVDLNRMQASEQQYFAREATAKLRRMSNADRVRTIHELRKSGFEGPLGASSQLLLAGLAISVLDEIAEKDSEEAREVSSLCTAVTQVLQNSTAAIEQFSLAAECLDIILRLHPRGVTQFNIDNCLAAVCTTMSRGTASSSSPELARTIYTRLCRLLGTIVGLYRQQLGGRFHVLVPALQCLLKALFGSNPSQRRNNNKRNQVSSVLSVPHAVLFSRLLTSLCDPTVSAVSRPSSHRHEGLIDQTKKAKVIAGQHLRILIESYAHNMLEAPLKPDIKAALAPGLYAVLDAMPTESKRGLNAGMDVSARAIFKTLHEDYVRFGKWNSKG